MKSPIFKTTSFGLMLMLLFAIGCKEDKAREQAIAEALEAPVATADPAASTPSTPTQPATVGTLPLQISSKKTTKGSDACLSVTARNFNQIVSMQYSMKWDKNVLKLKGLQGFNLPGLTAENFGKNNVSEGILTYSWYDANVRGITRPDNANLYEICFEVVGSSGSKSLVEFANAPTIIEIANVNSQFFELQGQAGTVEVE